MTGHASALGANLDVINVGLDLFASSLADSDVEVTAVAWRPAPAEAQDALDRLAPHLDRVHAANDEVVERLQTAEPRLVDVQVAREAIAGLGERTILHAGPPVAWDDMCGPLRGAITGALMFEGLADSAEDAVRMAAAGDVDFAPCHEHGAVGPMAGVVSPSMPMWVVEDAVHGTRGLCTLNEGLGKTLRHGAYDTPVLERLSWMRDVLGPAAKATVRALPEPLDLRALASAALQMGDECHNRLRASTSLLLRELLPVMIDLDHPRSELVAAARFMNGNDHFGLNPIMAGAKATADAARGVRGSSIVTCMARNGTEFGMRLSGTGDEWFTGPAGIIDGLFLPGYGPEDANPDIGDSTITETVGLGAFAMAAAPAIVKFIGGRASEASLATLAMYDATWSESRSYQLAVLDFRGTPLGVDALEVVHTGVLPIINTGIAGKIAGTGQVGAGLTKPPMGAFVDAVNALAATFA
jgi:hypothetical protein